MRKAHLFLYIVMALASVTFVNSVKADILYYDNRYVTYYWELPQDSGVTMYAVRMTPTYQSNLIGANIYLYGDPVKGTPDLRVHVYADNSGLPGTELGAVDVAYGNLLFFDFDGAPTHADLSSLGLTFLTGEDFHIGVETVDGAYDTTMLALLSDDGTPAPGTDRSSFFESNPGGWMSIYDAFGDGYNFIIEAEVAPVPEPATMLLLGTGLVGVAGAARRKNKNQA